MKSRVADFWLPAFLGILICFSGLPAAAKPKPTPKPSPTPLQRTMSNTGLFAVYGPGSSLRLGVSRRSEELRDAWNAATGLDPEWKWTIVVRCLPAAPRRFKSPTTNLYVGDEETIKIQVDLPIPFVGSSEADIAILRALALEYSYRAGNLKAGKSYNRPPAWLLEGIWQEAASTEGGVSAALFDRLIKGGPPPRLDAFLKQRPELMDPTSRAVFRAQAMALYRALLDSPEGKAGLAAYLSSVPTTRPEDPAALLNAFPSLAGDPANLAKLWTLSLAHASSGDRSEMLTTTESEKRLSELLESVRLPSDDKASVADDAPQGVAALPALARTSSGRFILSRLAEDLLRFESRAHPLYRPMVEEFRDVATQLSRKPQRDAAKRLAAASELREALRARSEAMADHLNWFEATRMSTPSDAFIRGPEIRLSGVPDRSDPISSALDAVEKTAPDR